MCTIEYGQSAECTNGFGDYGGQSGYIHCHPEARLVLRTRHRKHLMRVAQPRGGGSAEHINHYHTTGVDYQ
jgi:hypothetical protein